MGSSGPVRRHLLPLPYHPRFLRSAARPLFDRTIRQFSRSVCVNCYYTIYSLILSSSFF